MTEPDRDKIYARVGTTVSGKYMLLRVIGIGGMGAVYEAENSWTERRVAIKLVLAELTKNKDVASRFVREARAASKVSHPNIVEILDAGQDDDGSLFIVQELLVGSDLRHLLDSRKTLSPEHALEIIAPIASALIAAHRRGVVHRDLKPENFMLSEGPSGGIVPKLIDFGIAKMTQVGATSVTRTSSVLGTAHYLSPEQARGDATVDAQSDVWALGVVLFEMLSGRCPFEGDSYNAIIAQILMSPVPRLDKVSVVLADVVAKAMKRDRALRYKNVQEFLGALLECSTLRGEEWHESLRITHRSAVDAVSSTSPTPAEFDESNLATRVIASTTFGHTARPMVRTSASESMLWKYGLVCAATLATVMSLATNRPVQRIAHLAVSIPVHVFVPIAVSPRVATLSIPSPAIALPVPLPARTARTGGGRPSSRAGNSTGGHLIDPWAGGNHIGQNPYYRRR